MPSLLWWPDWVEGALLSGGALAAWSLALYVGTRGGTGRVAVLTSLTLGTLAAYLLGQALAALTPEHPTWRDWIRWSWWAAALVPALWLQMTFAIGLEEKPTAVNKLSRRLYLLGFVFVLPAGIALALVGTFSDTVLVWSEAAEVAQSWGSTGPDLVRHTPRGAGYVIYELYLLISVVWAAVNLVVLWRSAAPHTPLRARFGWLVVAALLFLLSGAELTVGSSLFLTSGLPGHILLIAGLAIMGWNVARYGALVSGETVSTDFTAFALSIATILAIYTCALLIAGPLERPWIRRMIPLLLLVTATHVLVDRRNALLERILYGSEAGALRWRLRSLSARIARQPDFLTALTEVRETMDALTRGSESIHPMSPPSRSSDHPPDTASDKATVVSAREAHRTAALEELPIDRAVAPQSFRVSVEGALRRLNDLPALSEHPLIGSITTEGGTSLGRAAALRNDLAQAVERLAPEGTRPALGAAAGRSGWLHHLVLYEAYIDGRPNKQIMQRYQLSEGTFHRARRRAIDAIATDLYQRYRS